MVKVSVIMPVHNASKYVEESIQSVLDQTFTDFEFIIINDGSTDLSGTILNKYSKLDNRLKILNNSTNLGVVKSLNIGLKASNGVYIARIDADDIWLKIKLQKQVDRMEEQPMLGLLGTAKMLIDEQGQPIKNKKEHNYFSNAEIRKNILKKNLFCHSSVIYRSEVVSMIGFYNEEFINTEDYEYWIRIINKYRVEILKEMLVYYRISSGMVSLRRRSEQLKYVIRAKMAGFRLLGFKPVYFIYLLKDVLYLTIPDWSIIFKKKIVKYLTS